MTKRLLSLFLSLALILSMLPVGVLAEELSPSEPVPVSETESTEPVETSAPTESAETDPPEESSEPTQESSEPASSKDPEETAESPVPEIVTASGVYVNPIYAGKAVPAARDSHLASFLSEGETYTQITDLVAPLREAMCDRSESAVFSLELPASGFDADSFMGSVKDAVEDAMAHTGVPTQGDYLRANFIGSSFNLSYSVSDTTASIQLTVSFTYCDTAAQEAQMDAAVDELLAKLSPSGTDYQKLCAVYDYITRNIVYDNANLSDDTYLLKFSPYAALVNKTAVCQGYAGLLYRLCLEMGIDCRMITGTASGGGHAWNIVKLDGSYYNVDSTWDAGLTDYAWFLLTDGNFSDHTRDSAYASSSFYSAYPMGSENYTPAQESEAEILSTGSCGANLTYTLTEDGVLTITGTGAMTDYNYSSSAPWYGDRSSITSVILSQGITSIGSYAFYYCSELNSVTIPEGVTSIGSCAFYNCSSLASVSIPQGVTSIGSYAFYGCSSLASVSIPKSVTRIGDNAFDNCPALTDIFFAHTASDSFTIGESAFLLYTETPAQTRIHVPYAREPHAAVSGYDWAGSMRSVSYLSTASLPATGVTIDTHEAEIEAGLELALTASVEPSNATSDILWSIDEEHSTGTASIDENGILVGLTPGLVTVRAASADDSDVYGETVVTILEPTAQAETILITGDWEFPGEAELGTTLQMYAQVLPGNTADKSVTWSVDSGTGSATIDQNGLLTALTPGTVTVWATTANEEVEGSCSLNIVRYSQDIAIFLDGNAGVTSLGVGQRMILSCVVSPEDATCQEVVWSVENGTGSAKLETYYSSDYPPQITGLTPGTVTLRATSKDSRAVSVSVELTVSDVIGTYALSDGSGNLYYNRETGVITGCDSTVVNVSIPASIDGVSITAIAPYAFCPRDSFLGWANGLANLASVSIPASVTTIGDHAFHNCGELTSVRINTGGNLTTIGDYAFRNCQKLGTLRLNTSGKLTSIGDYAFYSCEALTTVTIPSGVTTIGDCAFEGCDGITDLTIPDSVTSVGQSAFYWLSSLKNLTIPGELDTRGWLEYSYALESATFTGTRVISMGGGIDYGTFSCRNSKCVVISEGITTIESYAFYNCDNITEVVLPEGITTIESYTFYNCDNITEVVLPEGITTIESYAFYNCDNITEVVLPEGILTLGESAFSDCDSLEQMNIPQSLQTVGRNCFAWCDKLQLIDLSAIPDKLVEQEYPLDGKAVVPTWLIRATGGQASIDWECWNSEGEIGIYYSSKGTVLYSTGTGRCQLVCLDPYSGARGSKWVEASAGLTIRPADVSILSAGEQLQLSAWMMPDEQKVTASWSLGEGDSAYAILSSSGLLTARNVTGAHQITVTASAQGETATKTLWILPKTTSLLLYAQGSDTPVGQSGTALQTLDVDMFTTPTLTLWAASQPEDASDSFTWSSSAAAVAEVDQNGIVTLRKPGSATITAAASDGSGLKVSVKLNVIYLDEASKLTARAEVPSIGLQVFETGSILVFGSDPETALPSESLVYSIPEAQQKYAAVDAFGNITGLSAGTVTVTAKILGDPLNRSVSVKVKVIPTQSAALRLVPDAPNADIWMLDENGRFTEDEAQCVRYCVLLDTASESRSFTISPVASDREGSPITLGKSGVKWVTTDSKLAALAVQSDGTARITVPANVSGVCSIQGVTTDLAKNSASVWVFVRDYAPQLESASLTMNSYLTEGVTTGLTESYGNTITGLTLHEYDAAAKAYSDTPSARLSARYDADSSRLTLIPGCAIPNGTLKLQLRAECANDQTYNLPITLKIASKLPTVTVKQSQKFNTFYCDSEAQLLVTVKGETIQDISLADTDDFALSYDPASGSAVIRFSQSYLADHTAAPDTKATLLVTLEGWNTPISKAVTISCAATKPTLTTSPASSIVNTALSGAHTADIRVYNKTDGANVDLSAAELTVDAPFAQLNVDGETLTLTLEEAVGGTAKISVRCANWMSPITLTHKVTVQTTLPKVTFSASALKLNRYFIQQTASVSVVSSQSNLPVASVRIASTATGAAGQEAEKLELTYGDGKITARIPSGDNAPKAGSYTFTCTPYLADGTELASAKLKVTVDAALPKVKLSATSLKLNRILAENEIVSTAATVVSNPDYEVAELCPGEAWPDVLGWSFTEGAFRVWLKDSTAALSSYSLPLTVSLRHIPTGEVVTLPTTLSLSVKLYEAQTLSVSLSSKGKLDTQDPDSAITYTVSKTTNFAGDIEGVTLVGYDADIFEVRLLTAADKPTVELTMREGVTYSTKVTYKVQMVFRACGRDVNSPVLNVKVTQSALKFTKDSGAALYRQSQTAPLTHTVTVTSGLMGEIRLSSKTSPDFLNALGSEGFRVSCSPDGTQAILTFQVTSPAYLVRGKTYTVYLDVIPQNCASDKPATSLKLTVKVLN